MAQALGHDAKESIFWGLYKLLIYREVTVSLGEWMTTTGLVGTGKLLMFLFGQAKHSVTLWNSNMTQYMSVRVCL